MPAYDDTKRYFLSGMACVCSLLALAYILLTQSHSPVIALCAASVSFVTAHRYWKFTLLFLATGITVAVALYLGILPAELFIARGFSGRPEIWEQTLGYIMERPLFGHGSAFKPVFEVPWQPGIYGHTHNSFLASLLFTGIAGTSLLLTLIFRSFRYAHKAGNYLVTALLSYAIIILFINGYRLLEHPQIAWLYFWFPVAIAAGYELRLKSGLREMSPPQ